MSNLVKIGVHVIDEPTVMHNADFETAAWYEDIEVPAGEYPIEADVRNGKVDHAFITYEGTIVKDYFGSLYFGMPIGTYDEKKNAGKKSFYRVYTYGFMLGEDVTKDPEHWKLDEGWEVDSYQFKGYGDHEVTTYRVFKKE